MRFGLGKEAWNAVSRHHYGKICLLQTQNLFVSLQYENQHPLTITSQNSTTITDILGRQRSLLGCHQIVKSSTEAEIKVIKATDDGKAQT
jgi:hypothetical protein